MCREGIGYQGFASVNAASWLCAYTPTVVTSLRSEVTHKSSPDYCVAKSYQYYISLMPRLHPKEREKGWGLGTRLVLHGKILREVRGHTKITP